MDRLLSLDAMAERLHISPRTLRRHIPKLNIPFIKIGRQMLFDPGKVELYLQCTEPERKPVRKLSGRVPSVNKYAARLGL
jgi:excisionase family DNA binding protein